jgi:hypothetical protein
MGVTLVIYKQNNHNIDLFIKATEWMKHTVFPKQLQHNLTSSYISSTPINVWVIDTLVSMCVASVQFWIKF